jgi:alpha-1,6-mannosyltransferase
VAGVVVLGAVMAVTAAGGRTFDVPSTKIGTPRWIIGPFKGIAPTLTADQFLLVLIAMSVCYAAVLLAGESIPLRWVVIGVVVLHVLFALAPPLLSKDIFSYIAYARMGALHGVNPYAHGPIDAPHDIVYPFVGWHKVASVYGPLFTLATYALAFTGITVTFWTIKIATMLSSLALVWLVWWCAKRLGLPAVAAAALVGLNPILLAYGVGGAHNDIIMLTLAVAGVALMLRGREGLGAGSVVAGAAIKSSVIVILPLLVLGARDRMRAALGGVAGIAVAGAVALAAFGTHAFGLLKVLRDQQRLVSIDAIPTQVAKLFGLPGVTSDVRLLARLGLIGSFALLAWLVWRRRTDWITASGWLMFALVFFSTWLLGWYVLWPLPFAALSRDRRLRFAVLALAAYFVVMRWPIFVLNEG